MSAAHIEIEGLDEMVRALAALDRDVAGDGLRAALGAGGHVVEGHAKVNIQAQGLIDLGVLVNSVGVEVEVDGTEGAALIGPSVEYGAIHEFGGVILPRHAPYLRFQIEGEWVSARQVTIPARPYLRPALDEHRGEVVDVVKDTLRGYMERGQ